MYVVRKWSVRHARFLEAFYERFERILVALDPLLRIIGYERLDAPVAAVERVVKGFLFDCRMCGDCLLSSTGMACPMNCPKGVRNGPCGGVRFDGHCEIEPETRCVWIDAWEGAARMRNGDRIRSVRVALDHRLKGRSAWLRAAREQAATHDRLAAEGTT